LYQAWFNPLLHLIAKVNRQTGDGHMAMEVVERRLVRRIAAQQLAAGSH